MKQWILIIFDGLSFLFGFWLSLATRHWQIPTAEKIELHIILFIIVFGFWFIFNYINGLYDLRHISHEKKYYKRFIETGLIALIVSIVFFYLVPNQKIAPKTILLLNILFGYGISALFRFAYISFVGTKRLQTNIIFVGVTNEMLALINYMKQSPESGYNVVSIIDTEQKLRPKEYQDIEIFKNLNTIRPAITNYNAHIVVIAPHIQEQEHALPELYQLLFWNVSVMDVTSFYEQVTGRIPPSTFSESWFLEHLKHTDALIYSKIRRLLDYIAAIAIGAIFVATFPFIALAIKITSKGPLFFTQHRIGYNGQQFTMYKFRSMYALAADGSAEENGWEFAKKKDKRITTVGKFLRKTRLDELPQFWNLFRGDMTLIGPRPERPAIVKELEARMPYYPLRHLVRPGITGWAVLHQHYTDTLESSLEKLQYDLYYIKNRSFLLDISILLRTINVVIRLKGQ